MCRCIKQRQCVAVSRSSSYDLNIIDIVIHIMSHAQLTVSPTRHQADNIHHPNKAMIAFTTNYGYGTPSDS